MLHVRPCKAVPLHCIRFAQCHSATRILAFEAGGKPAHGQSRRNRVQHGHVAR